MYPYRRKVTPRQSGIAGVSDWTKLATALPCRELIRNARTEAAETAARVAHRPQYRSELIAAARELAARGLRPADIAGTLGVSEAAVTALLAEPAIASAEVRS